MNYFLLLLFIIVLLFLIVDGWMAFNTWQKRIHIGRWNNRKSWQHAVEKKASCWLQKTPKIPISDETRLVLWDFIRGKYSHNNIQSWQYAGLIMGLEREEAYAFYQKHDLKTYNSTDSALLMYALFNKNILGQKDLIAYADKLNIKNDKETIPYRSNLPNIRFVDSIGMLVPFMTACGFKEKAICQIKEYDKTLLKGIFPPHAYNIKSDLPLGIYDWGRGLGWYILGITETFELEGNKDRIIRLADNMINLQQNNGGLGFMFFSQTNIESTGSALLGILFVKAYEITNNDKYLEAAIKVEKALMKITRRDGAIDYAQGDTKGIGFYSTRFDIMPFAQGLTLLLSKRLNSYI